MDRVARPDRAVGMWLMGVCGLVAAMVIVGGATRLTDSGLSITEWNFAKQIAPPMSEAAWAREFDLYRQTTEYQVQNRGMSLAEFQYIYWWEWGHRFLGKVVGLAFALPFAVFLAQGRLRGRLPATLGLFALGALQGYVGWWMVTSGLTGRLDVAPYRLAAHLGMAFLIFGLSLRLALGAFGRAGGGGGFWAWVFAGAVFIQVLLGAMVAGSDAGRAYADWPTIGGEWVPTSYWRPELGLANLMENHAATQFNHRTMGYLVGALGIAVGWLLWRRDRPRLALLVGAVVTGQVALGVATVVNAAPLGLSLAHQALALGLWALAIVAASGGAATRRTAIDTPASPL